MSTSEPSLVERLVVRSQVAQKAKDALDEWFLLEVLGL